MDKLEYLLLMKTTLNRREDKEGEELNIQAHTVACAESREGKWKSASKTAMTLFRETNTL